MNKESFPQLIKQVRNCSACAVFLPQGPKPILQVHPEAKLLLIGQAPGRKVHQTGVPWDDASGERLREWLGLPRDAFYNEKLVAIVPMGFCYPGTGPRGDLPPRKECFDLWHKKLLTQMPQIKHTILLGRYAHAAYLKKNQKPTLTETVCAWKDYLPSYFPLPHPSPLNNIWLHKNRWFLEEVLPFLRERIRAILTF